MMLSSQVLSSPSCWRIDLTCSRARRSLGGDNTFTHITVKYSHTFTAWHANIYVRAHTQSFSYLSICDRYLVWNIPGVFKASVTCPLNSKPPLVKSNNTCRTTSPKYIPLVSFSNLYVHKHTYHLSDPLRLCDHLIELQVSKQLNRSQNTQNLEYQTHTCA